MGIKDQMERVSKTMEELPEWMGGKGKCPSCAEKEAALCRAREAVTAECCPNCKGMDPECEGCDGRGKVPCIDHSKIWSFLGSSTGPCRHEGRIRELDEAVDYLRSEWMTSPERGLNAIPQLLELAGKEG